MSALPTVAEAKAAMVDENMIGEGSTRRVYWDGKSKWAFKYQYEFFGCAPTANQDEYKHYLKAKSSILPDGIRIPEMVMLDNGMIATEHIKGDHPNTGCWGGLHECPMKKRDDCWYTQVRNTGIESIAGFGDISYANVIVTKAKEFYIIDLEF